MSEGFKQNKEQSYTGITGSADRLFAEMTQQYGPDKKGVVDKEKIEDARTFANELEELVEVTTEAKDKIAIRAAITRLRNFVSSYKESQESASRDFRIRKIS